MSNRPLGEGAFGPEPAHDLRLTRALRSVIADPPMADVDWAGLSARINRAVDARQRLPWWSYATQWERLVLPLALAAGLAGAIALFGLGAEPQTQGALYASSADAVAELIGEASTADVARSFARSVTSTSVELSNGVVE